MFNKINKFAGNITFYPLNNYKKSDSTYSIFASAQVIQVNDDNDNLSPQNSPNIREKILKLSGNPNYHQSSNDSRNYFKDFRYTDAIGFFLIIFACLSSVIAGSGGGGLYTSILTVVMGMDLRQSTRMSQLLMFGGTFAGFILNFINRHPYADRPLIDLNLVFILAPIQIGGAMIGVLLNKVLPIIIIVILLEIIFGLSAFVSLKNGLQSCRKRKISRHIAPKMTSMDDLTNPTQLVGASNECNTPLSCSHSESQPDSNFSSNQILNKGTKMDEDAENSKISVNEKCINNFNNRNVDHDYDDSSSCLQIALSSDSYSSLAKVNTREFKFNDTDKPEDTNCCTFDNSSIREGEISSDKLVTSCSKPGVIYRSHSHIIISESKSFSFKWFILLFILMVNITLLIIRGGKDSINIVEYCGTLYWMIYAISIIFLIACSFLYGKIAICLTKEKISLDFHFVEGDLKYNLKNLTDLWIKTFTSGVIAGISGVSGGILLGVVLIHKGVNPQVVTAVNTVLMVMTSTCAGLYFLIIGGIPYDTTLFLTLLCFTTVLIGKFFVDKIVKRHDLSFCLTFVLFGVIVASMIAFAISGTLAIIHKKEGSLNFMPLC